MNETESDELEARRPRWGLLVGVLAGIVLVLGAVGWGVYRVAKGQNYQLKMLHEAVSAEAGPDELIVVDDRLLGWALGRTQGGLLKPNLAVTSEDVAPSSLLVDLEKNRREIVVVARPDSRLLRTLSAAGYRVVKDTDKVTWETRSRTTRILGWGAMRIFFVMPPKTADNHADEKGAAVSSEMQHDTK